MSNHTLYRLMFNPLNVQTPKYEVQYYDKDSGDWYVHSYHSTEEAADAKIEGIIPRMIKYYN